LKFHHISIVTVVDHGFAKDQVTPATVVGSAIALVLVAISVSLLPMLVVLVAILVALVLVAVSCESFLAFISLGSPISNAHVSPVSVQALNSVVVATSTLPAAVVLAFGVTVPVSTSSHCPVDKL
jgi:hypothetical protein